MFTPEAVPDGAVLAPHHFYLGVGLAVWGFVLMWPWYPRTGALMTLIGLWVAVDDAVQHALQVTTPLGWLWHEALLPILYHLEGWA